jgi:inhibitor of cysteine peptidase
MGNRRWIVKGKAPVLILIVAALLLALGLAACGSSSTSSSSSPTPAAPSPSPSPTAAAQVIKVDSVDVPPVVSLRVGDQIQVQLHSKTASTGYVWAPEGMEQEAVLKQVGAPLDIPPKSKMVGASGKTQFTFEAMEAGTEQLGFWYARPSDKGNPAAAYALVVKVGKGHLPVTVKATEDYTAETAELRTGDTLQVVIRHATKAGKAAWTPLMLPSTLKPSGGQKYSSANGGTVTMNFIGVGTGTSALVVVNRPAGDVPLQTFSLPVYVKQVTQPITQQVNKNDANETFKVKAGDTVQLTLPAQPSTGYGWKIKKPEPNVLKLVRKAKFVANTDTMGAKGKMIWTFSVVGAGKAPVRALLLGPDAGSTGPAKEFDFTVVAKPGVTPKVIQAVDSYPSDTQFLKPGDRVALELSAKAGSWVPQGTSGQLTAAKPVTSGGTTTVMYTAKKAGIATPLLIAQASGGWPNQAYAFSAVVGKGTLPKTVSAAEHHVATSVQLGVGDTFTLELPGNATTGYTWAVSPLAVDTVIEPVGDIVFAAGSSDLMGAPGVFTAQFKAVAAGSVPLIMLYQGPGSKAPLGGMWMTMVTVQ